MEGTWRGLHGCARSVQTHVAVRTKETTIGIAAAIVVVNHSQFIVATDHTEIHCDINHIDNAGVISPYPLVI
jgi:hypothetical protein